MSSTGLKRIFFFLILLMPWMNVGAFLNLNTFEQPYILQTQQIIIPQYDDAFNPCIIRWREQYLMTFRTRDPQTNLPTLVGITWLDRNFTPVGVPQILHIDASGDPSFYIQDPRLVEVQGKLYMAYSDLWEEEGGVKKRRMFVAEIHYDGVIFSAKNKKCLLDFDGILDNKFEKNWVPFDYEGNLLLAYSLSPHKIFCPDLKKNICHTVAFSKGLVFWNWGTLRGGTPALLVDDHYLAFFHSSTVMATVQSEQKSMTHYVMGAYLFEKEPPFSIKKISPKPIVAKEFYEGPMHHTWKPLRVVFPMGFVYDDDYIWVSYGRQDYEAWIVKLDKKGLLSSLIPFYEVD